MASEHRHVDDLLAEIKAKGSWPDVPRIARGLTSISVVASTTAEVVVPHGLGTLPGALIGTATIDWWNVVCYADTIEDFKLRINAVDGVARTTTIPVYWLAVA